MTTLACVLRSGGEYRPEHVYALRDGALRHYPDARFVCLSDTDVPGVERIALRHHWPGWFSKLEILRPEVFAGPVLYLDLDSVIVGDLSEIAGYRGAFAMISDFYRPGCAQSGVLAFQAGPGTEAARLWSLFRPNASQWMRRYRGDGEWLHAHANAPDRLQDLYPGQVVSYKRHCREGAPVGARIVCGHGHPRPWHPEWAL